MSHLLYKNDVFEVESSETFLSLSSSRIWSTRLYTRDILLVKGILHNESLNIIVNHWSSRREGEKGD